MVGKLPTQHISHPSSVDAPIFSLVRRFVPVALLLSSFPYSQSLSLLQDTASLPLYLDVSEDLGVL